MYCVFRRGWGGGWTAVLVVLSCVFGYSLSVCVASPVLVTVQ